jgi:hypothetical protein
VDVLLNAGLIAMKPKEVCVENNFSILESKLFLIELLKNFKIELKDKNANIEEDPLGIVMGPKLQEIIFTLLK